MEYVGIQTQIWKNNTRSVLLLIAFPLLIYVLLWFFLFFLEKESTTIEEVFSRFWIPALIVSAGVALWFLIAWMSHTSIINKATGAKSLERKENMRVYNLVENLCMSKGMRTPKIQIIHDESLNAYASGISERTYTVTLSEGIINRLDDDELEGVIAHELTHIRNRDVRLLIISIVFVGIFAFIAQIGFRSLRHGRRSKDGGKAALLLALLGLVGYLLSIVFRFALSRRREFMADAGAVEMTKKPQALASALRKISGDPYIEAVKREDVAQLFIEHPSQKEKKGFSISSIFATHPPIKKRIEVLEQF